MMLGPRLEGPRAPQTWRWLSSFLSITHFTSSRPKNDDIIHGVKAWIVIQLQISNLTLSLSLSLGPCHRRSVVARWCWVMTMILKKDAELVMGSVFLHPRNNTFPCAPLSFPFGGWLVGGCTLQCTKQIAMQKYDQRDEKDVTHQPPTQTHTPRLKTRHETRR